MNLKSTIRRIITIAVAVAMLAYIPAYATEADYYDLGFMLFNGVYINKWGQEIPNVAARGIDVSSYQGTIDWAQVATDDVSFAFIRCGATNSGPDKMYDVNCQGATANGIPIGIYYRSIYAINDEIARAEALYTINAARKYSVTLPLVYDIEGESLAALGTERLQRNIKIFCDEVTAAGYTPMVYTSKNFMNTYIKDTPCTKWIARYNDTFDYSGGNVSYWQCSSHGLVKGIQGRVDIDFRFK